ncbi:hypothetical protein F4556_003001 [Kitasatospora gansuensis]|uniref:DUF2771 domain-containing protein n=1 Tax=Kitasatospora gansuensis TaxID=258050 RepID=A0A7W7SBJ0_9ACTN|nr:hypothetical protein [Kitasatospora gansuensis]MBB4947466.1 hypothetical protein [Kitasatospora gansuensis]
MSLSTRVIAALGAVVVIGAGTVGGSIAYASGKDEPKGKSATLVVGRSSITSQPHGKFCYNDGKPLDEQAQAKCQESAAEARKKGTLPTLDVKVSDRIGVGVDPEVADKGWFAFTDGGQQQRATLASTRTGSTFSGLLPASGLLASTEKTTVTVVEANEKTGDIISVWYFQLKNEDAVGEQQQQPAAQQSQ